MPFTPFFLHHFPQIFCSYNTDGLQYTTVLILLHFKCMFTNARGGLSQPMTYMNLLSQWKKLQLWRKAMEENLPSSESWLHCFQATFPQGIPLSNVIIFRKKQLSSKALRITNIALVQHRIRHTVGYFYKLNNYYYITYQLSNRDELTRSY